MSDRPELKAAYQRLEAAIDEVVRLEEWEGVTTEWIVLVANQWYAEDGTLLSDVGQLLPDRGNRVPAHRVVGLIEYARMGWSTTVAAPDGGAGDE